MQVRERQPGDVKESTRRAAADRDALRRDRYRAVLMAIAGDEATEIAAALGLGRARRSVRDRAYAYRDGGVDAVQPKPRRGGRPTTLPGTGRPIRVARPDAGSAAADDGACVLRGRDVVRDLGSEVGVRYTLGGAYALLHHLRYSWPVPRPRRGKADPAVQERFRAESPVL